VCVCVCVFVMCLYGRILRLVALLIDTHNTHKRERGRDGEREGWRERGRGRERHIDGYVFLSTRMLIDRAMHLCEIIVFVVRCSALQYITVCYSALQCVAVRCSALQCVLQ